MVRWRYNIRLEAAATWYWLRRGDTKQAGEFAQRLLDTATAGAGEIADFWLLIAVC